MTFRGQSVDLQSLRGGRAAGIAPGLQDWVFQAWETCFGELDPGLLSSSAGLLNY